MALPSSGSISTDQIRTELGLSAGTAIIIPDTVRVLAGKPTGSITLPNDLWGKSSAELVNFTGLIWPTYGYEENRSVIILYPTGVIISGEYGSPSSSANFKGTTASTPDIYEAKIVNVTGLIPEGYVNDTWYPISTYGFQFTLGGGAGATQNGVLWVRQIGSSSNVKSVAFSQKYQL